MARLLLLANTNVDNAKILILLLKKFKIYQYFYHLKYSRIQRTLFIRGLETQEKRTSNMFKFNFGSVSIKLLQLNVTS